MKRLSHFTAILFLFSLNAACSPRSDTSAEDRILIAEQVSRYSQLWDRKDSEEFSRLFTKEGVMEWHLPGAENENPIIEGRSAILDYSVDAHTGRLDGRQSRHQFSNLVFEKLSDSEALTEHIFLVTHQLPGQQPTIKATGTYRIQWKKTDEGWLMSHRELFVDR